MLRRSPSALLLVAWLAARSSPAHAAEGRTELWVDASAAEGGDGSRARPLRALGAALQRSPVGLELQVHLATGFYRGPFELPAQVRLSGTRLSVLLAEGDEVAIRPRGPVTLEGVTVQGGRVGIEGGERTRLVDVQFRGQTSSAIHLQRGALESSRCQFAALTADSLGISIEDTATAHLAEVQFVGPFRRAIELRGSASLLIDGGTFDGPVTAVHQVGGKASISAVSISGGRGPALFSARGEMKLLRVDVFGHEYAVLANDGASLIIKEFSSIRSERAGIALVKGRAEMEGLIVIASGSFGGVQLVSAVASLRRFWIHRADAYGVQARDSRLSLRDGAVTDVRDQAGTSGDGIQLRQSEATIESVSVQRTQGVGLLVAEGSKARIRDLRLVHCGWAGIISETEGEVDGSSVVAQDSQSAAVVVLGESRADFRVLTSERNQSGAFWVECHNGARTRVWRLQTDEPGHHDRCVRGW